MIDFDHLFDDTFVNAFEVGWRRLKPGASTRPVHFSV